jgi:hypothetical protein
VNREPAGSRWLWFSAWALPGVCFALSVSALAIFALPLGIVATLVLGRRSGGRDALGLLVGVGVGIGVIGSINLHYQACSAASRSLALPGGHTVGSSCGGVDGVSWLIAGIVLTAAAVSLYLLASRRSSGHGPAVARMVG